MTPDTAALILKQVRDALVELDVDALERAETQLAEVRQICSDPMLASVLGDLRLTSRFAASSAERLQDEVSRLSVAQFGYAPPGATVLNGGPPAGGTCG